MSTTKVIVINDNPPPSIAHSAYMGIIWSQLSHPPAHDRNYAYPFRCCSRKSPAISLPVVSELNPVIPQWSQVGQSNDYAAGISGYNVMYTNKGYAWHKIILSYSQGMFCSVIHESHIFLYKLDSHKQSHPWKRASSSMGMFTPI